MNLRNLALEDWYWYLDHPCTLPIIKTSFYWAQVLQWNHCRIMQKLNIFSQQYLEYVFFDILDKNYIVQFWTFWFFRLSHEVHFFYMLFSVMTHFSCNICFCNTILTKLLSPRCSNKKSYFVLTTYSTCIICTCIHFVCVFITMFYHNNVFGNWMT